MGAAVTPAAALTKRGSCTAPTDPKRPLAADVGNVRLRGFSRHLISRHGSLPPAAWLGTGVKRVSGRSYPNREDTVVLPTPSQEPLLHLAHWQNRVAGANSTAVSPLAPNDADPLPQGQ